MKRKNIFKRIICVFLTILMAIPELFFQSVCAVSSTQTTLLEKDPIIGTQFDDLEAADDVLDEPNINVDIKSQRNNWWVLKNYDNLPYNEIHKRVQNNIWNNPANIVDDGELKIVYSDGAYGFADISYRSDLDSLTYIWEVKPPSYRDINQTKGLNQLSKYVNSSTNYRNGSLLPGSIHDSSFSFNLTLSCSNGYDEWLEYVTYNVSYEVLGNGLIIYDFIRSSTKEKKQKEEKTNSEAETGSNENAGDNTSSQDSENSNDNSHKSGDSVIPLLFPWWLLPGGGNSNTGSSDNISDNDSKPSITQLQGGKQNNRKVAIGTVVLTATASGTAVALAYLITHAKTSTLKGFIPPLSYVESSALFIRNNGTLVHAKEGDFYVLPDTAENAEKVQIIEDAKEILEELLELNDSPDLDVPDTSNTTIQFVPEGEFPLLLTFNTQTGAHKVICYGQELGAWKINNKSYDVRILVWDSNYPDALNEDSYLYYNSESFEYCIPQYGLESYDEKDGGIVSVSDVRSNLNAYLYQAEQCRIMGDINLDGEVSGTDAVLLSTYLTTEESLSDIQLQLSDISRDKKVNAVDLTLLKRRLLS